MSGEDAPRRVGFRVRGIVQGVGFRPFVYTLAESLGLAGFVHNDEHGVVIEIEGPRRAVERFGEALRERPPALARIDEIDTRTLPPRGETGFRIAESATGGARTALISPDVATCGACLAEIADPAARRYRYPFTNCTSCGPRFTITRDVPYDRPNTTMAGFVMCADCEREYHDPRDRRFHAQPIACPACGPQLALTAPDGAPVGGDPIEAAAARLADGAVVAVKGLGGYHLACHAFGEDAVARLRGRKHREDKPFAVMVSDVETAARLCAVSQAESELLESHRRPIVLLARRAGTPMAPSVAPGNRHLGIMLPYTPLHHLLLDAVEAVGGPGTALVMTSGNLSDEPIAHDDADAYERLGGIADLFLTHDRPIHVRCDDTVTRVWNGGEYPLRRSRGYAPEPLRLKPPAARGILACGGELKHTFCLAKHEWAFLSHHIGDLENWETMQSFLAGVEHFSRIFAIRPEVVAHDLHPEYLSTKWAKAQVAGEEEQLPGVELEGAELVGVQHHHAHIAACLADNGIDGTVIGLALDGTGWGDDGTIWGCEVLVADRASYRRAGHLRTVPLPGGAAAIREPWRMGAVYLTEALGEQAWGLPLSFVSRTAGRWGPVLDMARTGVNTLPTSSAGRLFDALAAACVLRERVNYEGQAAVELEQEADPREDGAYSFGVTPGTPVVLDGVELFSAAVEDLRRGASVAIVAARFHNGLARGLVRACSLIREQTGIEEVALSGGTFQNVLLCERTSRWLREAGFSVHTHRRVPANDGGIALGQLAVAATRT